MRRARMEESVPPLSDSYTVRDEGNTGPPMGNASSMNAVWEEESKIGM